MRSARRGFAVSLAVTGTNLQSSGQVSGTTDGGRR